MTLVGAGGLGKTRTSLRVAARLLEEWRDGVWFFELAPLSSGDYIPTTVAAAMRFTLAPGIDPTEALVSELGAKRALLVFDNCAHIVSPVAHRVATILRACPEIRILATSRQGLGLDGEALYRMPPLAFPSAAEASRRSAAAAQSYSAIRLCVARARASNQHFALRDDTVPAIAEICRRLDGIPLAMKLAASRLKMLDPQQLRDRLDERFRILTGGSRDVLPRQQTLRALIDWSYDLLAEREQRLFRQLGIFVNGFTLDGATAIGGGDEPCRLRRTVVARGPIARTRRPRWHRAPPPTRNDASLCARKTSRERRARRRGNAASSLPERSLFCGFRRFAESGRNADIDDIVIAELEDVRAALDFAMPGPHVTCGGELLAARRGAFFRASPQRSSRTRERKPESGTVMLLAEVEHRRGNTQRARSRSCRRCCR